ncbi:MerR family transcriptional regulator [Lacticaseibacillus nasuensis]|uniref:HTH merR-type domain-containing protein n=1 Tax=Lacticaseibacillus nasuensis JCM 17158 TaxID=1291734 RepID=A0A0R1JRK9_9LACO|nr:MerR family transcriptional regulator [Lacticaseibacillus nasuensis]KRK71060.1 hypothetical protein FD02_GL000245 [Lacticaseibacillus nasuensis JCM 17158]
MDRRFTEKLQDLDLSMGIGETSRVTGASQAQIRYWEKKGIITSFRREDGGNKRFNLNNVATIIFVQTMVEEGYTLAKAAALARQRLAQHDVIKHFIRERLQEYDETGTGVRANLGPLANDPGYDVVATIGEHVTIEKVKRAQEKG